MVLKQPEALEKQIFRISILLGLTAAAVLFLMDLFYFKNYVLVSIELSAMLFFAVWYFLQKKLDNDRLIPLFVIFQFLVINAAWYFGGGLDNGNTLIILLVIFAAILIIPRRNRKILIALVALNIVVMMIWEFFDFDIRQSFESKEQELVHTDIFLITTFTIGIYYMVYVKNRYDHMQELLAWQNQELSKLNEELLAMNSELEGLANEKTQKLRIQNQKLINYAFMNAHKVRGPLARIMGLVHLLRIRAIDLEERPDAYDNLYFSAEELDTEIKAINNMLYKEDDVYIKKDSLS